MTNNFSHVLEINDGLPIAGVGKKEAKKAKKKE